jgi:hypothetical protein
MKHALVFISVFFLSVATGCSDDSDNSNSTSGDTTSGADSTDGADGSDNASSTGADSTDSADATDGASATATDAADGADSTDGASDTGTDAADGADGTVGSSATDAADSMDGMTGTDGDPNAIPPVQLDPPENGFQIRSIGRFIDPGTDVEFCEVVTLPGTPEDTYYVDRLEVAMHQWSHHVIIDAVVPGSETEEGLEDGQVVPCVSAASAYGEDLVDVIGAQSPYADLQLPEGIGRIYYGGQKVIIDYHYFNPTTEKIPAGHALNFHLVEESDVQHVADNFGFYNLNIFTMPGQTSKYAASCTFDQDVMISLLTRHTHRWGTDFHIWYKGGDKDGDHIWTSNDWELETNYVYDEPILVRAGEGFRFQCEYDNTTDKVLKFGPKATDEMCILFGIAWSPDDLYLPTTGQLPGASLTCVGDSEEAVDM